jgi:hypothetical protein
MPSWHFQTTLREKRGFRFASFFNGLRHRKMSVHPCTERKL